MSWWQKRGRKYSSLPPISDPVAFGAAWQSWWTSLRDRSVDDVDIILRGGSNGFVLVLILLGWWGRLDTSAEWKVALGDVQASLTALAKKTPAPSMITTLPERAPAAAGKRRAPALPERAPAAAGKRRAPALPEQAPAAKRYVKRTHTSIPS
jgi:hypothetical protein